LVSKVESCPDHLSGRQLAMSLNGLKGMNRRHAEVRSILKALEGIAK
jgi:hypothetical protein